ncbi:molybdopterin-guanine dinucleotide biosynthesis protein B [Neobacillus sp. DY30]|uniref:molybdopterin-guanine dinucleotide biosynthesis protein B n=1 Tax=Neobacillus sp. DY30 TaxID=3047871 RepID=UPI0024BFE91B|nr:molybdopterin-guanine dinucleotide biosynthesis protein B [Neobacillus sp. DY30]WHY02085.1 molybdopterin-guanine dinucleotide biosynthesis protein B [Neobacillus sp. DY30]
MALVKPIVFQIVGYQNSGKTTTILKLIEILKDEGIKSVTIKHHGHGGKPDIISQKDSAKHINAGAVASLVEGEGRLCLQADDTALTLEEQINFVTFFNPDIIIIEGHKKKTYPKLLILRDENDLSLIYDVCNIQNVIVWKKELLDGVKELLKVPVFHIEEEMAISEISKKLINLVHNIDEKN